MIYVEGGSGTEVVGLHTSSTSRLENCAPSIVVCKSEKIAAANPKTPGLQMQASLWKLLLPEF